MPSAWQLRMMASPRIFNELLVQLPQSIDWISGPVKLRQNNGLKAMVKIITRSTDICLVKYNRIYFVESIAV